MVEQPIRIGRFDQVKLLTTQNVSYLSDPSTEAKPGGIWSVAGIVGEDWLLLVKNNITIRIPAADVLKVAGYNLEKIMGQLGRLSRGEEKRTERKNTNP